MSRTIFETSYISPAFLFLGCFSIIYFINCTLSKALSFTFFFLNSLSCKLLAIDSPITLLRDVISALDDIRLEITDYALFLFSTLR
jgi:hypothetical protein